MTPPIRVTAAPRREVAVGEVREAVVDGCARVLESKAAVWQGPRTLTGFSSVREPAISIRDYAQRARKHMNCSIECFVLSVVYIDRAVEKQPDILGPASVHRLWMVSMILAAKFNDDVFFSNAFYGRVGGVQLAELNKLEAAMLQLLDWKLHVTPEEFEVYRQILSCN